MIEKIRDYIATCPLLNEYAELNINYLVDKSVAYSINEESSYNPVVEEYLNGTKMMKIQFNLDSRLIWNEDIENNIANSKFFENFRDWLKGKDETNSFPQITGIIPVSIKTNTNGFIFATDSNIAIYRISCEFTYTK